MPSLTLTMPDRGIVIFDVSGTRVTVGRRPDNTIQIMEGSVSGHHAEFILEDGHYRLHDCGSTNFTTVDGAQITDFHLHRSCRICFGYVECEYDAVGDAPRLSTAQMEKDMAFLRAENQELLNKNSALQRQVDMLSSAKLLGAKAEVVPAEIRQLTFERDELRFQNSGLRLEVEKLRAEMQSLVREREQGRPVQPSAAVADTQPLPRIVREVA